MSNCPVWSVAIIVQLVDWQFHNENNSLVWVRRSVPDLRQTVLMTIALLLPGDEANHPPVRVYGIPTHRIAGIYSHYSITVVGSRAPDVDGINVRCQVSPRTCQGIFVPVPNLR